MDKDKSENEIIENLKLCPHFTSCNAPKCPLDFLISERVQLPEDDVCPLLRFKRKKGEKSLKGIKTALTRVLLANKARLAIKQR